MNDATAGSMKNDVWWKNQLMQERERLEELNDSIGILKLDYYLADLHYNTRDLMECIKSVENVLLWIDTLSYARTSTLYTLLMLSYEELELYEKAIEVALRGSKELYPEGANQFPNLWVLYYKLGLIQQALDNIEIVYRDRFSSFTEYEKASYFNNIGAIWLKANETDSARHYYEIALNSMYNVFASGDFSPSREAYCLFFRNHILGNIAICDMNDGNYDDAIYFLKFDNITNKMNGFATKYVLENYNDLAACYLKIDQSDLARAYIDSARLMLNQRQINEQYLKNIRLLSDYYMNTEQYDSANYVYRKYAHLKDSVVTLKRNRQVLNLLVSNDLTQKRNLVEAQQLELEKTKMEMASEELSKKQERLIRILLISGLIALLILLISIYFINKKLRINHRLLKEQNKQISEQKLQIEGSLLEKETLLKEIHHRVKNNLQVISGILEFQSLNSDSEQVKMLMKDGQQRIQSIALIHQRLYEYDQFHEVSFNDYVTDLSNAIALTFTDKANKVEFQIEVNDYAFDIDTAVPLGLIINELFTNSFKHGLKNRDEGLISLKIMKIESHLFELRVFDNGLPPEKMPDAENSGTLGFKLINGLSWQLGGSFKIELNNEQVEFIIRFTDNIYHNQE